VLRWNNTFRPQQPKRWTTNGRLSPPAVFHPPKETMTEKPSASLVFLPSVNCKELLSPSFCFEKPAIRIKSVLSRGTLPTPHFHQSPYCGPLT